MIDATLNAEVRVLIEAWENLRKFGEHEGGCTFGTPCRECGTPSGRCDHHAEAMQTRITAMDTAIGAMCARYEGCHAELLAIHEISSHGWANVLQHPITPNDTLTVRDVKIMAMELMKDRPAPEIPNPLLVGEGITT